MANFIQCSIDGFTYRRTEYINSPVNIDLVTQVQKIRFRQYPDNEGVPAIKFHGIDAIWKYSKTEEKTRDEDFTKIINEK